MPMTLYMSYDLFMMYMTFHAHEFMSYDLLMMCTNVSYIMEK
jgi:hypothetical protein